MKLGEEKFDELFPKRPRARYNAFKWLAETRYVDTLAEIKPTEKDYDHIVRLSEALQKLRPILEKSFPEENPFPSGLQKNVQQWEKSCKPKPKEAAAAPGAGSAGGATVSAALNTPKDAQLLAKKAATFMFEKEPLRPMGYRLNRALRWDMLDKAPPVTDGKTQLPAPVAEQRAYFQKLVAEKNWKTANEKIETAFTAGANHMWLDLQRIAAEAAKELGPTYAAVRDAIMIETAFLLKRIPELVNLSFNDGSSYCDETTKQWIASEVQAFAGGGTSQQDEKADQGDELKAQRQKANELVSAGKIAEALDFLQEAIGRSSSEGENFQRSLMIGMILLNGKKPDVALSVLESLNEKIAQYHLEKWNPDLAVETWETLIKIYKVARVNKPQNLQAELSQKHNEILKKISQINPKKAFSLT